MSTKFQVEEDLKAGEYVEVNPATGMLRKIRGTDDLSRYSETICSCSTPGVTHSTELHAAEEQAQRAHKPNLIEPKSVEPNLGKEQFGSALDKCERDHYPVVMGKVRHSDGRECQTTVDGDWFITKLENSGDR